MIPAGGSTAAIADHGEIEGYPVKPSYNVGEKLRLCVSTIDPTFTVTIYRVGWYGGAGARRMTDPISVVGRQQPVPPPDPGDRPR